MKILIVGSGGREHALATCLKETSRREVEVICAPGNAGIVHAARCVPIEATNVNALAAFAAEEQVALTLVGGEAPLAAGIADVFADRKLKIAAPNRAAARLETSKAYAKEFMRRNNVPTANCRIVETFDAARSVLRGGEFGGEDTPVVVKADGLAAGKGVVVAQNKSEAERAAAELLMLNPPTIDAPSRLLIEEALEGREVSLLFWTDGRDYRLMPPAQDHKRIGTGDTGANTGGMGAVTDGRVLDDAALKKVVRDVVEPTLAGLQNERIDFRGVLYVGLMLSASGARVLEYNTRFGDPEAQAILMRLTSDLAEISEAVAESRLGEIKASWLECASACVVLAARGYPGKVETGARIEGLNLGGQAQSAEQIARRSDASGVRIFHSGTRQSDDGAWLTAGGRVLGLTACSPVLEDALQHCYRTAKNIAWDGVHYRTDIGRGLPGASPREVKSSG